MAETGGDITVNEQPETAGDGPLLSAEDMIVHQLAHLDQVAHQIQAAAARIESHLTAIQADLDAYRPLLDKWKNSGIARLASGRMPWQQQ